MTYINIQDILLPEDYAYSYTDIWDIWSEDIQKNEKDYLVTLKLDLGISYSGDYYRCIEEIKVVCTKKKHPYLEFLLEDLGLRCSDIRDSKYWNYVEKIEEKQIAKQFSKLIRKGVSK